MKNIFKKLILLCLILGSNYVFSQNNLVTISVNVLPPYTPYISDYLENPSKVIITLYLQSATISEMDIYLHGSLTGESGIHVYTDPDYKPGIPISLQNNMPYTLSADDMAGMYSMSNVIFDGISPQEVMTNGALPEDYYQICIRAFNFDTDEPVSAETPSGCSAPFLITNLEPPMFTSPFCPDEIQAEIPQNVYINWTIPMGANPSMISYFFRMIEIPDNSGIDPVDALNDNNYASVYEEELNTNSLLLTSDKVQLVPGNIYAFFVQAISLDQLYYFNNDGVSEACWFKYNGDSEIIGDTIDTNFDISDFIDQFELIPSTKVSGRLFYKVPESGATPTSYTPPDQQTTTENQQIPAENQGFGYSEINTTAIGYTGNANYNQIGFVNTDDLSLVQGITGAPPFGRGTLHKSTESME
ncbi:MAG: hypothetical protein V2I62_00855, partial [Bacteroidales bacterium]|nr:hypothetical protein [Bacteroidales bacterium]